MMTVADDVERLIDEVNVRDDWDGYAPEDGPVEAVWTRVDDEGKHVLALLHLEELPWPNFILQSECESEVYSAVRPARPVTDIEINVSDFLQSPRETLCDATQGQREGVRLLDTWPLLGDA